MKILSALSRLQEMPLPGRPRDPGMRDWIGLLSTERGASLHWTLGGCLFTGQWGLSTGLTLSFSCPQPPSMLPRLLVSRNCPEGRGNGGSLKGRAASVCLSVGSMSEGAVGQERVLSWREGRKWEPEGRAETETRKRGLSAAGAQEGEWLRRWKAKGIESWARLRTK